jgi:UDP-N-acetyl-D-glucosamine dehydrogenase
VGAIDEESQTRALAFYESICDAVVSVSSPEVAEAAKLLENTFRLVNIALINEFTQLCSASGINVHEVIDAASSKPYGFMPFRPGVGVGGHCIPVDPLYLVWWAQQNNRKAAFVEAADLINQAMPKYVAERALSLIDPSITTPKVLILGVAYKPGVGDIRETPVSELRDHLKIRGAQIAWHDPLVPIWEGLEPVDLGWECDVAILSTMQTGMDIERLIARGVHILDCTNTIKKQFGVTAL